MARTLLSNAYWLLSLNHLWFKKTLKCSVAICANWNFPLEMWCAANTAYSIYCFTHLSPIFSCFLLHFKLLVLGGRREWEEVYTPWQFFLLLQHTLYCILHAAHCTWRGCNCTLRCDSKPLYWSGSKKNWALLEYFQRCFSIYSFKCTPHSV